MLKCLPAITARRMRPLVIAALVLIVLAAGWRYRGVFADLAASGGPPPKPFVFDNGSVRDLAPPASAPAPQAQAGTPPGTMRKCVKGSETTYTNFSCPPGFKEKAIATDRVTVLEGQGPAAKPAPDGAAPGGRKTLQQALDVADDGKLRQKIMDRAIDNASR